MEYELSKLWESQFFGFYEFKSFYEYASDVDAQKKYFETKKMIHYSEKGRRTAEMSQELLEDICNTNEVALKMIKNHMIVFLYTRFEVILQETIRCLLCNEPNKILRLIDRYPSYKEELRFSLKEFVISESKDKYIETLSNRLSYVMLSGKPSKVVERLKTIFSFESVDMELLDELMDKRNNIVHEGKNYVIEIDELEGYLDILEKMLFSFGRGMKMIGIDVIDSGGFLRTTI